jgi:thiol-disulfide isomerase/thioredoxin
LDFWAKWCVPCRKEVPFLKDVYSTFGKDERFLMIGLSLDKKPDPPRKYAEENGLLWMQGFLGALDQSTVAGDYGVVTIPSIWLVGPDGRIVAKGLRGERIKEAVAQALGGK